MLKATLVKEIIVEINEEDQVLTEDSVIIVDTGKGLAYLENTGKPFEIHPGEYLINQ